MDFEKVCYLKIQEKICLIIKKSLEYIKKYGFAVVLDRVKENSYIRKNPSDYE